MIDILLTALTALAIVIVICMIAMIIVATCIAIKDIAKGKTKNKVMKGEE